MGLFGRKKKQDFIDIRDLAPETIACQARWGQPGVCPKCKGRGYLDKIDMRFRVMHQHCIDCQYSWEVSESDAVKE